MTLGKFASKIYEIGQTFEAIRYEIRAALRAGRSLVKSP